MAKKKQGALKPRKGLLPGQYKKTSTVAVELVDTLSEGDGLYITRRFIIDTERLDGNYSFTIEHRGVEWKIPGAVFRRMVQQVEAINKEHKRRQGQATQERLRRKSEADQAEAEAEREKDLAGL